MSHATPALAVEISIGRRRAVLAIADGRPALQLLLDEAPLARIALGVDADGADLAAGAEIVGSDDRELCEEWSAALGKATGPRSAVHRETTVTLRSGSLTWAVVVRVSDDGFAFRYVLPATATSLGAEHTRIDAGDHGRAWVQEYQTWYETPRFGSDLRDLAPGSYGFPVLVERDPQRFLLLSESDIDGRSSGAHVDWDGTVFHVTPADDRIEIEPGHRTPWRVIVAGTLAEIVATELIDALAPAAQPGALGPRPGRAAWSWWSSQYSGAYLDVQKRFTDFAAEQGWEHVLVDCGWDAAWVPELVAYASARGIQVHLWSAWSDLDGAESLRSLALWRSWGVAGIKVDFMESESQERYRWYDAIIAESARVGLMVNFHGSVIPRGWARTHPHVVSYEGIRGAEYYVFYGHPLTAAHNVIQPFTRNVVGSMDYTPVTFSAPERETTDAHELALGVAYESGITHFADDPDQYRSRPLAAAFLAELPPTWDEVRLLDGHPDTHAVVARRSGDRWFVGSIAADTSDAAVELDPAALVGGPAAVWAIGDVDGALAELATPEPGARMRVPLAPCGGFVAIVAPAAAPVRRAVRRAGLPRPTVAEGLVVLRGTEVTVGTDAASVRTPPGWTADRGAEGEWTVTPLHRPDPGDVAVLTLESPGHDGVPVMSHVRVLTPFDGGVHDVSRLPFVSARNAVGPVERGRANGGGDPRDGGPLQVRGVSYPDGLGVSQDSEITIAVAGSATRFTGSVAVDDETPDAAAVAEILVDGVIAARFTPCAATAPLPFDIDVTGASLLTLRTSPDSATETHVDWLTMRLSE
ncbi:glycoside hydrolase family 97 catalytic domain-containing protein [Microbacterium aurugineum]|uniref:glycoside hydrolase family 97 catalytic domain-containing protein n=1 Tax=Microbacterium aurugineum TaxID=2851642 RepID=UPI0020C04841|nr:glycoside hydrolase family 97 catalytic domain-containing protein [Microbacterium aurugineum]MCK8475691.1 glycoside hydrolase family 97 catalytic domain-containing protein [Microbacterium aurugineum]